MEHKLWKVTVVHYPLEGKKEIFGQCMSSVSTQQHGIRGNYIFVALFPVKEIAISG